ncbi:hypothetical protein BCR34DRAFT_594448 [Clohesyomyces aquaticus]|uniref:Mid2 domain-containing protein n=1 Tax=Clohesyomyces aquaticus TaxID=1231657 RepID=A0A1Y1Y9S4_9PLEO|nr:hypothetical protein BCR34DRAFT_594448 [Clohesyomyces aquaticus]
MPEALTTTFTPPSQCTTDVWYVGEFLLGGENYSTCLPTSFKPASDFFYSPGLHCPYGYTTACTRSTDGTSVATCCPNRLLLVLDSGLHFKMPVSTRMITALEPSKPAETLICDAAGGVNAYSVQLRFQASDLVTTTFTPSETSAATSRPTNSTPDSTHPTNIAAPSSSSGPSSLASSSLPIGAKTGIGVGVGLGAALVGAMIFLSWTIRKNMRQKAALAGYVFEPHRHSGYDLPEHTPNRRGGR